MTQARNLDIVKIKYKMETGLENFLSGQNRLSHISKTKSNLFHEHKENLIFHVSDNHKRNLSHLSKNSLITFNQSPAIWNHTVQ